MQTDDIPVLTKVYQANAPMPATMDMAALTAQLKQALLPELSASLAALLAQEARRQVGASIEGVEDAFREAMQHVGKQHLQQVETALSEKITQLTTEMTDSLRQQQASLTAALEVQAQQWLADSQQAFAEAQHNLQASMLISQEAHLTSQLHRIAETHNEAFKQSFGALVDERSYALEAELQQSMQLTLQAFSSDWQQQLPKMVQALLARGQWVFPEESHQKP